MIPKTCLLIATKKFPILPGEEDELSNENMYGKALCMYLKEKLPAHGVEVPYFVNEDWGWAVGIVRNGFKMDLCIYSDHEDGDPEQYAVLPSIRDAKAWSWSKFRSIDISGEVIEVMDIVVRIFEGDREITSVTRHDDYPFPASKTSS